MAVGKFIEVTFWLVDFDGVDRWVFIEGMGKEFKVAFYYDEIKRN
jgi:hypothetical protein